MILDVLNQIHEAKQGNSLSPNMLSYALKCTHGLFYRKTMLGGMTTEKKEQYIANADVTAEMFTYGNHQGIIETNREFQSNVAKLESYFVDNKEAGISRKVA